MFSYLADKNSNDSDEEGELLSKETSTMFHNQGTEDKIDQKNSNKNKKINIVK